MPNRNYKLRLFQSLAMLVVLMVGLAFAVFQFYHGNYALGLATLATAKLYDIDHSLSMIRWEMQDAD